MPTDIEKQWIAAWRFAGPELQRIRDEELSRLDEAAGLDLLRGGSRPHVQSSGLVAFQAWMMRLRVLNLMRPPDQEQ